MSATKKASGAEIARKRQLFDHERVIEGARKSFIDMGRSLAKIRNDRLYGEEFDTFAEYCETRWEISEAYANRVINAARVALQATPIGVEINSEAVARELVTLTDEPELLRQVWDEAERRAAGGRVTAALVAAARDSLLPPAEPPIEGEVVDPLSLVPAAAAAVDEFFNNQTPSGGVPEEGAPVSGAPAGPVAVPAEDGSGTQSTPADPPTLPDADGDAKDPVRAGDDAGQPEQDHRDATGDEDGAAAKQPSDAQPPADGTRVPAAGDETDPEVFPQDSGVVDGREQPETPGVSTPAAPDPEAFDKFLDEHVPNEDPHQKWRAAFLRAIRQSYALSSFSIDDIANNGNDMCFGELINLRDFMDDVLTKVQTKRVEIKKQQAGNLPDNVREFKRPA